MRSLLILFLLTLAMSCADDGTHTLDASLEHFAPSNLIKDSDGSVRWTLTEINVDDAGFSPVSDSARHILIFHDDGNVDYISRDHSCSGTFVEVGTVITLRIPCNVPTEEMWWEYLVKGSGDNRVIVYPRLNPTAREFNFQYRYLVSTL